MKLRHLIQMLFILVLSACALGPVATPTSTSSLPEVLGEVADEVAAAYEQVKALEHPPTELAHKAVYYYAPPLEQVRAWIAQAGLTIEEEGRGSSLHHFIVIRFLLKRRFAVKQTTAIDEKKQKFFQERYIHD